MHLVYSSRTSRPRARNSSRRTTGTALYKIHCANFKNSRACIYMLRENQRLANITDRLKHGRIQWWRRRPPARSCSYHCPFCWRWRCRGARPPPRRPCQFSRCNRKQRRTSAALTSQRESIRVVARMHVHPAGFWHPR